MKEKKIKFLLSKSKPNHEMSLAINQMTKNEKNKTENKIEKKLNILSREEKKNSRLFLLSECRT